MVNFNCKFMSQLQQVILVDELDNEIGTEDKLKAHQSGGRLHRAFSVFIFNSKHELMLQKRAGTKYHSGGLWTNTCCSHPRPGETTLAAARRRLQEEMGFDTELKEIFSFIYRAELDQGLTEHELDHVLIGFYDEAPQVSPDEAAAWQWISLDDLLIDIKKHSENYTEWFKIILRESVDKIKKELVQ
jgi:isopentenyl-diphosphate delta-isomerase